jgi:hypothetical protein
VATTASTTKEHLEYFIGVSMESTTMIMIKILDVSTSIVPSFLLGIR